jgi:hypothetical protein
MMEQKELTEDQKKKLNLLFKSTMKNGAITGAKFGLFLFLTNAIVIAIDVLYVRSQVFALIGGAMNAIFIFRAMGKETKKEHDRVRSEAKKILES